MGFFNVQCLQKCLQESYARYVGRWSRKQRWLALAVLCTLWLLSGKVDWNWRRGDTKGPAAVKVEVSNLKSALYETNITLPGTLKPAGRIDLPSQIGGKVLEVLAYAGQVVQAGDVIVRLDPEGRDKALESAREALAEKTKLYEIGQDLAQKGYNAQISSYTKKTELATAAANYERAKAEYNKTLITAPFAAFIAATTGDPYEVLAPSTVVATLFPINAFKADVYMSTRDIARITKGAKAVVVAPDGVRFDGAVTRVDVLADPTSKMYKVSVKVILEDEERYPFKMLGSPCRVIINTGAVNGFAIPGAALVINEEGILGANLVRKSECGTDVASFRAVNMDYPIDDGFIAVGDEEEIALITRGGSYVKDGGVVDFR